MSSSRSRYIRYGQGHSIYICLESESIQVAGCGWLQALCHSLAVSFRCHLTKMEEAVSILRTCSNFDRV